MPKIRSCIIGAIACVLLLVGGLLGLALLLNVFLVIPDPKVAGPPLAREGVPIVEAIYKFKAAHGLWPERLDDLVPDQLPALPDPKWTYYWTDWGHLILIGRGVVGVSYSFDEPGGGWGAGTRDSEGVSLSIAQPKPSMSALSADEWRQRKLAELDRRIKRDPKNLSHWKMKIALWARAKKWDRAIATCQQAIVHLPDSWRLHMTLAYAQAAANPAADAAAELEQWIGRDPTFVRYWCLFNFYKDHSHSGKALDALRAAGDAPWGNTKDMEFTNDALGYSTACYALQQRELDLALVLCARGEKAGYGVEPSYLAIRAAAHLAKGEQSEAIKEARQVIAESKKRAIWAENLDGLLHAAEAGDKSFAYDPGTCGDLILHLFTCYE